MKNELKTLYHKDKKLAFKVAKVLGYKIVAQNADFSKLIKKLGIFNKAFEKIDNKLAGDLYSYKKKDANKLKSLSSDANKFLSQLNRTLDSLDSTLNKAKSVPTSKRDSK